MLPGQRLKTPSIRSYSIFFSDLMSLQSALISDEKAKEFRCKVYSAILLTKVVQYLLIALGLLSLLVAFVFIFMISRRETGSDDEKASLLNKQDINKE